MGKYPEPCSVWRHKSGRMYVVLSLANMGSPPKDDYPPMVIYAACGTGEVYAAPADNWEPRMTRVWRDDLPNGEVLA